MSDDKEKEGKVVILGIVGALVGAPVGAMVAACIGSIIGSFAGLYADYQKILDADIPFGMVFKAVDVIGLGAAEWAGKWTVVGARVGPIVGAILGVIMAYTGGEEAPKEENAAEATKEETPPSQ